MPVHQKWPTYATTRMKLAYDYARIHSREGREAEAAAQGKTVVPKAKRPRGPRKAKPAAGARVA